MTTAEDYIASRLSGLSVPVFTGFVPQTAPVPNIGIYHVLDLNNKYLQDGTIAYWASTVRIEYITGSGAATTALTQAIMAALPPPAMFVEQVQTVPSATSKITNVQSWLIYWVSLHAIN